MSQMILCLQLDMDSDVFGYLPQLKNNEVKEEDYDGDDDSSKF